MNSTDDRQKQLELQILRLGDKIKALTEQSRRFTWIRVGIVFLGGLTLLALFTVGSIELGWIFFALLVVIFGFVVQRHRRLEDWIRTFEIWQNLKGDSLARLRLDWNALPDKSHGFIETRGALEIDLDLTGAHSLHHLLDICVSNEGSQLLADWLSASTPDLAATQYRQQLVRELAPMARFRNRLTLNYRLVSDQALSGEKLNAWMEEDLPEERIKRALPWAFLLTFINLVLFLLNIAGVIPALWILTLTIYIGFYYLNFGLLSQFMESIVLLDNELGKLQAILNYLERYSLIPGSAVAAFCRPFRTETPKPSMQLRSIKIVTAAVGLRMNIVMSVLLNIFFPWDYFWAFMAGRYRRQLRTNLPVWLGRFYQLEALASLANFAFLNPHYAFPEFDDGFDPVVFTQEIGHPLLPLAHKKCNDFVVRSLGDIGIVTGSNMAGKSTFIKTLGINYCLGYAGGPVNARSFRSRPFRLHTCIRISDSITDGYSYFYAEVTCLKSLLNALEAQNKLPVLFLIDEIFRGTNNKERLVGSRAYLRQVAGGHGVGLVATHDLELATLADQNHHIQNYHFLDHLENGRLAFDYQIHSGPSPSTNALKIMRMEGLPVEDE